MAPDHDWRESGNGEEATTAWCLDLMPAGELRQPCQDAHLLDADVRGSPFIARQRANHTRSASSSSGAQLCIDRHGVLRCR
jgi:hypothetical protein